MKISRPYKNVIPNEPTQVAEISQPSLGFSPMLNSMLSLVIKDGFSNHTTFNMLYDIYPYVSAQDRNTIKYLLSAKDIGDDLSNKNKKVYNFHEIGLRPPLNEMHKMFNLLNVMKKYSGLQGSSAFTSIERIMKLKYKIDKTTDQFDIISEFIPESQRSMINIIKAMGSMKNGGSPMDSLPALMGMMNNTNNTGGENKSAPSGNNNMANQMGNIMNMMNMMNKGGSGNMSDISSILNMMKNNS